MEILESSGDTGNNLSMMKMKVAVEVQREKQNYEFENSETNE